MPPIPPPPPPPPSLFGPQKGGSKPPPHTNERSKLLNDIEQGPRRPLKKTVTNDRLKILFILRTKFKNRHHDPVKTVAK